MMTVAAQEGRYRHWTPFEIEKLHSLRGDGVSRRECGRLLGRSFKAIKHKLETTDDR